jgi:hypothetical protein
MYSLRNVMHILIIMFWAYKYINFIKLYIHKNNLKPLLNKSLNYTLNAQMVTTPYVDSKNESLKFPNDLIWEPSRLVTN